MSLTAARVRVPLDEVCVKREGRTWAAMISAAGEACSSPPTKFILDFSCTRRT